MPVGATLSLTGCEYYRSSNSVFDLQVPPVGLVFLFMVPADLASLSNAVKIDVIGLSDILVGCDTKINLLNRNPISPRLL